jgi:ATP-binding protein involved in chromosome partitioning
MIDPRPAAVESRLAEVARIVPVTGGKGGIGKSLVAALLALALTRRGRAVGLLDLDLTGPCAHLLLGIEDRFPAEEFGVEPTSYDGIRFMSVSYFAGEAPAPLRGADLTNALLEILAITRWGRLDALVIDMPPGLGDVTLDTVRWIPRAEFVAVATPSRVVHETVRRTLTLLTRLELRVAGLVENMSRGDSASTQALARACAVPFAGTIPYDEEVEAATGDRARLSQTAAAQAVARIAAVLDLV